MTITPFAGLDRLVHLIGTFDEPNPTTQALLIQALLEIRHHLEVQQHYIDALVKRRE